MTQFYASIQGNSSRATCMGSKSSGIMGHIRGWDVGVRVYIEHDKERKLDIVRVYKTSGCNDGNPDSLIAAFTENA